MNTLPCLSLLVAASLTMVSLGAAQTPSDSGARPNVATDSAAEGYSDSADRVAADTTRPVTADSAKPEVTTGQPLDSTLVEACMAQAAAGDESRVLMVSFAGQATAADRSRAAASVGGKLTGQAPTGEAYIVVSDTVSIRNAADRLIQAPGVTQVTERKCQ